MAKPNYSFERRQKDLAKQRKKEEKRQKKLERRDNGPSQADGASAGGSEPGA